MAHIQTKHGKLWKPTNLTIDKVAPQKMFVENIDKTEEFIASMKSVIGKSVADTNALRSIDVSDSDIFKTGSIIHVASNNTIYGFNRTASHTDDGVKYVVPTVGGGVWITTLVVPDSLPANGGNADTVNGKTVESNVPANAKFTDTVYAHPNDANTRHVTDTEKATWNGKANGSHTHPGTQVTAGALPVGVVATNGTDYGVSRLRNIQASTVDLTPGTSTLASGTIYIVYE